ncbi:alpha/beta hydrolase [Candidatus Saccharibacteria bacterium]|nr:alpha/beta hydrolase [Candidatus Saccharibacteria bacterium]
MKKAPQAPEDFIVPLNINGLEGRMLRVPSTKKNGREILLLYGHHAILERWWGLVENLTDYGTVTMPDLPGFGGMESFYKIGRKPDIDAYADYLAAFIKLRYKRGRITIYAVSYGFIVATRMLQRYPELAKKVDILVSVAGFMHKDDFKLLKSQRYMYIGLSRFFATRPVATLIRYVALNKFVITTLTKLIPHSKSRHIEVDPERFDMAMNFEVTLWQANDVRTHMKTTCEFLRLDNCTRRIDLPVLHVSSQEDHYFNNIAVEQHMRQVFSDYTDFNSSSKAHVPSVIAGKKEMSVLLPAGLRKLLNSKTKSGTKV